MSVANFPEETRIHLLFRGEASLARNRRRECLVPEQVGASEFGVSMN